MVDGVLVRVSAFRVGLGVGRVIITSGSHTHPSNSCDGWVGEFGVVGSLSIFGLAHRVGVFTGGLLTFVLVSGFRHYGMIYHPRSRVFQYLNLTQDTIWNTARDREMQCPPTQVENRRIQGGQSKEAVAKERF